MRTCWSSLGLLAVLLNCPAATRAAEPADAGPTILARVQSVDDLFGTARYLAGLVDQEENGKQGEAFLRNLLGPKAFDGLDPKRPLFFYASLKVGGFLENPAVLMLPVGDEATLLTILERFNVKYEKDKDGLYTAKPANLPIPVDVYFRFANKYAYVTARNKDALAPKMLIAPSQLPAAGPAGEVAAVTLRIDRVPALLKQIVLQQAENQLAGLKERKEPGETKAQAKLREAAIDALAERLKMLLKDGQELTLRLGANAKTDQLDAQLTLTAKPGSPLATAVADLGKQKGVPLGLGGQKVALRVGMALALPEAVRTTLGPVAEELPEKAVANEPDAGKKREAGKLLKVLVPTLKMGELDASAALLGPNADGRFTLVSGLKIAAGDKIEQALRDLVQILPEKDRANIKLDAGEAGGVKLHRVEVGPTLDANAKRLFGKDAAVYLAFKPSALYLALGPDAESAVKKALAGTAAEVPLFHAEGAIARLGGLQKDPTAAEKVLAKVFGTDAKGSDVVRLSLEGGTALKLRLSARGKVLTFAARSNAPKPPADE